MVLGKRLRLENVIIVSQLAWSTYVLSRLALDAIGLVPFDTGQSKGMWWLVGYYSLLLWWVLASVSAVAILTKKHWGWWLECLVIAPLTVLVVCSVLLTNYSGKFGVFNYVLLLQAVLFVVGIGYVQLLVFRRALKGTTS